MFYIFTLFSVFINNKSLYQSFGFFNEYPIIIGFILFSDALAPLDTIVKFLMNILSRKFEFEAGKSFSSPLQIFTNDSFRRLCRQTGLLDRACPIVDQAAGPES